VVESGLEFTTKSTKSTKDTKGELTQSLEKRKTMRKTFLLFTALLVCSTLASAQPDFSGLWFPAGFDPEAPRLAPGQREMPWNETARGLAEAYAASFDITDEPGGFCVKPGLPRSVWGAPFPVEIVQTEGFINMLWEGYFQYRKIYLEGHPRPEPILHTGMGYSVGHYEGNTLVIETSYLREYPYMRRVANTDDATVVERWNIVTATNAEGVEQKYLTNEMILTDDRLYTEPVRIVGTLRYSPETPILEYSCSEQIYDDHLQEKGIQPPDFSVLP
jgi:hypothetical protein